MENDTLNCPIVIKFAIFAFSQNKIIKKEIEITLLIIKLQKKKKKEILDQFRDTKRNSI